MNTIKLSRKENTAAAIMIKTVTNMVRKRTVLSTAVMVVKKHHRSIAKTQFRLDLIWKEPNCNSSRTRIYFPSAQDMNNCYTALNQKVLKGLNLYVVK